MVPSRCHRVLKTVYSFRGSVYSLYAGFVYFWPVNHLSSTILVNRDSCSYILADLSRRGNLVFTGQDVFLSWPKTSFVIFLYTFVYTKLGKVRNNRCWWKGNLPILYMMAPLRKVKGTSIWVSLNVLFCWFALPEAFYYYMITF